MFYNLEMPWELTVASDPSISKCVEKLCQTSAGMDLYY